MKEKTLNFLNKSQNSVLKNLQGGEIPPTRSLLRVTDHQRFFFFFFWGGGITIFGEW